MLYCYSFSQFFGPSNCHTCGACGRCTTQGKNGPSPTDDPLRTCGTDGLFVKAGLVVVSSIHIDTVRMTGSQFKGVCTLSMKLPSKIKVFGVLSST